MNFYIDFEATESNRIIAIGCTTDDGDKFYSLVHVNERLSNYITGLTGITDEDLKDAKSATIVFSEFADFIKSHTRPNEPTFFFCYGNSDTVFLLKSIKDINDEDLEDSLYTVKELKNFFRNIAYSLIDYAEEIKKVFKLNNCVKLKKVSDYYKNEDIFQKHDPLEDAELLSEVIRMTEDDKYQEKIDNNPFKSMPSQASTDSHFGQIKMIDNLTGEERTFDNFEQAFHYVWDILFSKKLRKQTRSIRVRNKLGKAILEGAVYHGKKWVNLDNENILEEEEEEDIFDE